jgi:hypothetical protein
MYSQSEAIMVAHGCLFSVMGMSENKDNFFCNGWGKKLFPEDQHCINDLKDKVLNTAKLISYSRIKIRFVLST